jgi:hypothetical protein
MMRRAALALAFVVALGGFSLGRATAGARITATVRCAHPAEDSLAHVRLVSFTRNDDGSIDVSYRCKRIGY